MPLNERFRQLQQLNLEMRRQLEIAEHQIPEINEQIRRLSAIDLVTGMSLLGAVIHTQPYVDQVPADSELIVQVALLVPLGIGVCLWDMEEYMQNRNQPEISHGTVRTKFMPFDECGKAVKALILPHVEPLLERLMGIVAPLHRHDSAKPPHSADS